MRSSSHYMHTSSQLVQLYICPGSIYQHSKKCKHVDFNGELLKRFGPQCEDYMLHI